MPQVLRGFLMGAADIVPGVSGGTVALVLGIYQQLIEALHHCVSIVTNAVRGDVGAARRGLRTLPVVWLGALGVGILAAVFALSGPLRTALQTHPVALAGLFTGLIAAAVVLVWRQVHQTSTATLLWAAIAAVGTFVLLGLNPATGPRPGVVSPWWVFFLAGAVAICAMILPGISGSFLLVLLGMYPQVLDAVAERNLSILAVFVLGCATGLALASSALHWLLTHHHDLVIAAMTGLMIGSIRVLWPWPAGLESTQMAWPAAETSAAPIALAVLGAGLVLGLDALARRLGPARS